ncbi:MAG: OmpH family outer membrane protein [Deltaproteobacteria bacterium]|nr:OmpH family outer membrane protein [Deltaproteobacteria bacterium]
MSTASSAFVRGFAPWRRCLGRLAAGAAVTLLVLCAFPGLARAQARFAVIDLRRAVIETEDGLRVQAKLKQLFDSRQTELDGKQKDFQRAKEELDGEAKGGKLAKPELAKKLERLQQQAAELQTTLVEYQREMQRQESEATTPILQRMLSLVARLAAQSGYDMVVDKSAVPYFRSDLDVTDRIIQMYNVGAGPGPAEPKDTKKPAEKKPAPPPAGDKPPGKGR